MLSYGDSLHKNVLGAMKIELSCPYPLLSVVICGKKTKLFLLFAAHLLVATRLTPRVAAKSCWNLDLMLICDKNMYNFSIHIDKVGGYF
jgi:hypothetical protein